ncbi:MAG: hypothetical protein RBT20_07465 [Syntrophales bacterium]|nr:hypothetical protein [Syntrophales bacterium]
MGCQTTSQFPDPFDGVESRAVRRHEFQRHMSPVLFPPFAMQTGVVIFDVVQDHANLAAGMATDSSQLLDKGEKSFSVESFILPAVEELSVSDPNRAEIADSLSGGMMQDNRIGDLWRNPHPASRAMLLKTYLIYSPHVKSVVKNKTMEFFYMLPAVPDRHAPSLDKACETGTPDLEIDAGIAERQAKPPSFVR